VLAPGPDPRDEALREQRNAHLRRAIAILEDLRRTEPDNPSMRHLQALCYREIVPDRDQAGGGQIDRAIALLEGLVEDFPRLADYQFDLCETYAAVEAPGKGPGPPSPRQAQRRLSSALEVARRLTAGHPNVPEYLASRARLHHKYADLLRRTHRLADAIEHNREALTIQRGLVEGFPEIAGYRVWEAAFGNALAECLLRDGRGAEARRLAGETIDRLDAMRSGDPEMWYLHGLLADAHRTLAGALRGQGLAERAEKADRLADAHRAALREAMSSRDAR
jgi:tetratricopeptide (TPR) repeat protein